MINPLRLAVIPSLRLEAAKDTLTRPERYRLMGADTQPATYWLPNARLALVQWTSEQVTLRANLGRYGRLPSMIERYGNTGQLLGNPNLVPETGTNADVGANWTRAGERLRLSLDGALFAAWAQPPHLLPPGGNYLLRPGNLGRARILGAEVSATARLAAPLAILRADHFHRCARPGKREWKLRQAASPPAAPARLRAARTAQSSRWRGAGAGGSMPTWT